MGPRAALNFANAYMGRFEDRFVYKAHWYEYVLDWIRFINDIFMIWKGDTNSLHEFINHLNNAAPSINFTHEISKSQVNFLDTTITKNENGDVETDVYQKPTDTHPYLYWTSAHPPHLKRSIPYSQALRLRRICSDTNKLRTRINEYAEFFAAFGYNRGARRECLAQSVSMTIWTSPLSCKTLDVSSLLALVKMLQHVSTKDNQRNPCQDLFTIGYVRYINILTWLRGFRVKIAKFSSSFCLSIPKRDLDTKKTTPNIEF